MIVVYRRIENNEKTNHISKKDFQKNTAELPLTRDSPIQMKPVRCNFLLGEPAGYKDLFTISFIDYTFSYR